MPPLTSKMYGCQLISIHNDPPTGPLPKPQIDEATGEPIPTTDGYSSSVEAPDGKTFGPFPFRSLATQAAKSWAQADATSRGMSFLEWAFLEQDDPSFREKLKTPIEKSRSSS